MRLRDIGHCYTAVELLNEAEQELLQQGNDELAGLADNIRRLAAHIVKTMEEQTGSNWSND